MRLVGLAISLCAVGCGGAGPTPLRLWLASTALGEIYLADSGPPHPF